MHKVFLAAVVVSCYVSAVPVKSSSPVQFKCPLPVINVGSAGLESTKFERTYRGKRPVILQNGTGAWAAHRLWRNDGFLHLHGDMQLMARPELVQAEVDAGIRNTSLKNYLKDDALREFIFFDFGNEHTHRTFLPDCSPTPFPLLRIREMVAFSVGRRGAGSGAHQHYENWMSQIVGRKAWILAPPRKSLPVNRRPCDVLNGSRLPTDSFVCVVGEGETLYLPDWWHHATCNLDEITVGIGGKGNSSDWPAHLFTIQDGDLTNLKQAAAAGLDILRGSTSAPAVHYAARGGDVSVVNYLLEMRADPFDHADDGDTAVHWAAAAGHLAVLEHFGRFSKKTYRVKGADGKQPTQVAVEEGRSSCVSFLLSHRASVSSASKNGALLSHSAAGAGVISIFQSLLEHRAKFGRSDNDGMTPLHWAAEHGHGDAVEWLLSSAGVALVPKAHSCEGCQPIHVAANQNYVHILDALLVKRANFRALDGIGRQPLHWAAHSGAAAVTSRLLELKADLQTRTHDGESPADFAAQSGHKEVLRLLKKGVRKSPKRSEDL